MQVILCSDVQESGWMRYAGAYRLATALRQAGYSVQVLDFFSSLTREEAQAAFDRCIDARTVAIGFCFTFLTSRDLLKTPRLFQQDWMPEFLRELKGRHPKLKFLAGGNKTGVFLGYDLIDYWVTGGADLSLPALIRHLAEGDHLEYREYHGRKIVQSNEHYKFTQFNQSQISWNENDFVKPGECLPIELARGCIFRCAFCTFPYIGKRHTDYIKNGAILRSELIRNWELFGTTHYVLSDDIYNDSVEKVKLLRDVFTSLPFKPQWVCYARLDQICRFPEMEPLIAESGAVSLYFGIETFHHEAGRRIGKGYDASKLKQKLVELKQRYNLYMGSNFIIGLPEEDADSIRRTFDWLCDPDCPLDYKYFNPLWIPHPLDSGGTPSKISQQPEFYGYEQSYGEGWTSKYFTRNQARQLAQDYNSVLTPLNGVSGFEVMRLYNIGFSIAELTSKKQSHFHSQPNTLAQRRLQLKKEYLQKLLGTPLLAPKTSPCSILGQGAPDPSSPCGGPVV